MSRFALLLIFVTSLFAAALAGPATFADENPIRQVVSDGLQELENGILQVIGQTRDALSFARFATRLLNFVMIEMRLIPLWFALLY